MKTLKIFETVVLLMLVMATQAKEPAEKLVYKLNIKQEINKATWRQTQQAFDAAYSLGAKVFLIHMNTYGGTVLDADSIRTRILHSKIPVLVFIDNNAASAGALISIACDSIYMRPEGSIGAATVVNPTGQAMPDKYQSYMRSTMRATAEAQGKVRIITETDTVYKWRRDPKIAEAMVDPSVYIPGLIDSGKVLTFTPTEAIKYGFCEGTAESVDEVLKKAGYTDYKLVEYQPTFIEKIIGFLVNPIVSGLLIMAIIGGIYFEMQSPGIGFALGVAVVAAILFFAPLYLEGLAAHWEILVFVVGIILLLIEIFVIPGFGVTGISGIIFIFAGLVLSLINNVDFDFKNVEISSVTIAVTTVFLGVFGGFIGSLVLGKRLFTAKSGAFANLSLQSIQNVKDGFVCIENGMLELKGKTGVAQTVLRPSGKVMIDNEIFDAVAISGLIEKGDKILVSKVEATQLYVEKI